MANWTTADILILGVAGFFAVTTLVRLMIHRRDTLIRELEEQAAHAARAAAPTEAPADK